MANTYKNILITPNTGSTIGDPSIVFSGGDSNTNTDITLRVYPASNGTLSFEANAGQLLSITNDLSNTIFSVTDISGIPMMEINTVSQLITMGQYYGNVSIGGNNATAALDINNSTFRVRTTRTPASNSAFGNAGEICWDANNIYVCVAANTWKRAAIATW